MYPGTPDSSHFLRSTLFPSMSESINMSVSSQIQGSPHVQVRPLKRQRTSTASTLGTGALQCQVCHRSYERADHLNRHLDSHRNERSFRCEDCPAAFNQISSSDIKLHIRRMQRRVTSALSASRKGRRRPAMPAYYPR
ncbi:hypothetical protein BCR34DRAFT_91466 [Clohesyomyces aquaticus]|uniref:C2H2-type domain-containing protein n=1 Tax=Clohesyomyces aquaticus TaxID=1231657 RepID=A0A1Y1YV10_9PLEO|nr:hypothetical protein BCR34DRAFT_91466 [Clohesyomyces aquaticus]